MAIKQRAQGTVLAAMVCAALSGGTAFAATPGGIHDQQLLAAETASAARPAPPLRWDSALPARKEPAVGAAVQKPPAAGIAAAKPQPVIITAEDVRAQRKLEKAAEAKARREARPMVQNDAKAHTAETPKAPAAVKASPEEAHASPASSVQDVPPKASQETIRSVPKDARISAPGTKPLYVPLARAEAEPAEPAAPSPARPAVTPEPQGMQPDSAHAGTSSARPAVPPAPPDSRPMPPKPATAPRSLPVTPGTKYALQPNQADLPAAPPARVRPAAPKRPVPPALSHAGRMPATPQAGRQERPEVFRNISERAYRHIQAGMFAMQHQLREEDLEPATYRLIELLNENDKLSRLDKIEYVIGICYAINHSDLSEWQKQTLIGLVARYFSTKR